MTKIETQLINGAQDDNQLKEELPDLFKLLQNLMPDNSETTVTIDGKTHWTTIINDKVTNVEDYWLKGKLNLNHAPDYLASNYSILLKESK